MGSSKYLIIFVIVCIFKINASASSGQLNGFPSFKDTFQIDQATVNYIYNRAVDILLRHPQVFVGNQETPLFNSKTDTVFINPNLRNSPICNPEIQDSLLSKLIKIDCQKFFNKVSIENIQTIEFEEYYLNYGDVKNPNISISITNLYQFQNKIFLGAHLFWNNRKKTLTGNQIDLVIELDLCKDNFILFRKLYSNIFSTDNLYYVRLDDSKFNNGQKRLIEISKSLKTIKRNNLVTSYYEYDLGDKNCFD